jgi:hypothetical protein
MSLSGRVKRGVASVTLGATAAGLACVAALAPVAVLGAQVIRGVVTDRATNAPLDGVLLSVLDTRDTVVVQALSNEGGGFEIRLPAAATYSIDVKRIGVRRVRIGPLTIAAGETRRLDIAVEPLPAVLSSVRITGRTSCVRNPETNAKTAALWEDARAALTAAVISRGLTTGTDTVIRFERKLDVNTWRVLYETRRKVSASADHPFRSLPAEVLSIGGYVTVNQDGSTDYYAPDAEVLLSDTFLADHCFRIEPGTFEHTGEVGLGFEPIPQRKIPDVKGVLWMDGKSNELRTLEFTYSWLPNDVRTVDYGGTVSFFRMPGGRWIVRNWRIRMPEFGRERRDGGQIAYARSGRPSVVRISEEGGAVPLAALLNQAGRVHGTVVFDTVSNRPIRGITVALEGTADSTRTATDGSFELPFVTPGSYTVVLRHAALDSLGVHSIGQVIDVDAGKATTLALRFPSNDELALRMCGVAVNFESQSVIRFIVINQATGKPLSKAQALFSRVPVGQDGKPVVDSVSAYEVTLDDGGGLLVCGLRGDEIVRVEAMPNAPDLWGENIRPRAGLIGWHVIRIGHKR